MQPNFALQQDSFTLAVYEQPSNRNESSTNQSASAVSDFFTPKRRKITHTRPAPFHLLTNVLAHHLFPKLPLKHTWALGLINKQLAKIQREYFQFLGIIPKSFGTPQARQELLETLAKTPEDNFDYLLGIYNSGSISLENLSERGRGKLLITLSQQPIHNVDLIKTVYESGPISQDDVGTALVAAAGTTVAKKSVIQFLGSLQFEEGKLDIARDSKEENEMDLTISYRSRAVLAATEKEYIEVIDILLTQKKLLDTDPNMLAAADIAIEKNNFQLFCTLYENAYWLDADVENMENIMEELERKEMLDYFQQLGVLNKI
jgi:hypothetical protein